MGSAYQVYVILLIKVLHYDLSESVGHSPIIFSPVYHIFLRVCWITPEEIAEETTVRHIRGSQDLVDLLKVVELRRKATMDAEDLVIYYSSHWETVEALDKLLPQLQRIPSFALVIKSINSIDGATFVISSQEEEIFRVLNLIGEQQTDDLQILLSSVHIVAEEKIV